MEFLDLKFLTLLVHYRASAKVSAWDALSDILGVKIKTWTDLVYHFCIMASQEQGSLIKVYKNEDSIGFLKATFHVRGKTFTTDGVYNVIIPFNDDLELIENVLNAITAVLRINGYRIDPFKKPDFSKFQPQAPGK